jgi:exopolysaccharide biosynthesis polyprenyl glycosylphosphotransferase
MIRRHGYWLRALLMLVDGLIAVGLFVVLSVLRFGTDWAVYWRLVIPEPLAFLALFAVGWIAVLAFHGLYRPRARWSIRSEAADLARATVVMALLCLSVLFFFKLPDVSRLFLLFLFPTQFVLALGTRAALRLGFRWLREHGYNARFVVIVGAGPRGQAFARRLAEHPELGLNVLGYVDDEDTFDLAADAPLLGRLDDLPTILHERVVDEVAICLPFSQWNLVDAIARISEEEGKIVRVPMDVLDHAFAAGKMEELDGVPVFSIVSGPDRLLALALKRALDLAGSLAALILLSPVALAVGIAIRAKDGPPILFRQTRVGLHGRPFRVVKFRTMVADAEARYSEVVDRSDPRAFKLDDDPRVTPLGAFLRRTSLDELPQLWNVLRGEMSLVGPRPAPPREVEGYDVWHRRRLSMKPGITGLWQVTARSDDSFERRATLDLDYIDRWSLWLDVKILARTIPAALEGR